MTPCRYSVLPYNVLPYSVLPYSVLAVGRGSFDARDHVKHLRLITPVPPTVRMHVSIVPLDLPVPAEL